MKTKYQFAKYLTNTLWHIRSLYQYFPIGMLSYLHFVTHSVTEITTSLKTTKPMLKYDVISSYMNDLSTKVSQPWIQKAMFRNIQLSVLGLVECLNKIIREMNKNNDSVKKRHFASSQSQLVTKDTHLTHIKANEEFHSY